MPLDLREINSFQVLKQIIISIFCHERMIMQFRANLRTCYKCIHYHLIRGIEYNILTALSCRSNSWKNHFKLWFSR